LLHVAGVALLTLIINATTTGKLVNYLGLTKVSDIKKSILAKISYELDEVDNNNIKNHLSKENHFDLVNWEELKKEVDLSELKKKLEAFRKIDIKGQKEKPKYDTFNDAATLARSGTLKASEFQDH
jgi:hypothetical protein